MPKEITVADVRHMAKLSRLLINADEEKLFAAQFGQIVAHMDVLNSVPTDGVEPLYTPVHEPSLTREDEAVNIRTRSEILANAPETDGQCFVVPRIV